MANLRILNKLGGFFIVLCNIEFVLYNFAKR